MHNYNKTEQNKMNSWVVGCSILTCGMITHTYLEGISNLPIIHMKHKYNLELQQIEKAIDLSAKIIKEDKKISYYWKYYTVVFMMGISGLSVVIFSQK